jgi:hypothetical protein
VYLALVLLHTLSQNQVPQSAWEALQRNTFLLFAVR